MFIGVDVGTQSVRAALVDRQGKTINCVQKTILSSNPQKDYYEQDCSDIWAAVCFTVKKVSKGVTIEGIGFDATCSLVCVDEDGEALSIGDDEDGTCMLWMDHRAEREAKEINTCGSSVLKYVGGAFSPEQQPPKLLWIKRQKPECWERARAFFDLPDWLTFKATGSKTRSLCSVTCKWGYVASSGGWNRNFLTHIGLEDLCENEFERLGTTILPPGSPINGGVKANSGLGLPAGTPVGMSMIDAHAGALSLLRYGFKSVNTLSVISGTSTCVMGLNENAVYLPGVWGPYEGVILPSLWLLEGGQTAAGAALDHFITSHPASQGQVDYKLLDKRLEQLAKCSISEPSVHLLTRHLHVQPDIHGNRSPLALPWFRGVVVGLEMSKDLDNLALTYLAVLQGLALGVVHIIERLREAGLTIDSVVVCGGLTQNSLYLTALANGTGANVMAAEGENAMCLGSSMLASVAAGHYKTLSEAVANLPAPDRLTYAPSPDLAKFYRAKYYVYKGIVDTQLAFRECMNAA